MYRLKKRNATQRNTAARPIVVAQRRRQLYPLFFHMGPVALCITSVCLISLMAVLYVSQVARAEAANQQIQAINTQQAGLQRQNQDLMYQVARERSPEYIAENAQKQGLVPANPKQIQTIVAPNLRPIPKNDSTFSP